MDIVAGVWFICGGRVIAYDAPQATDADGLLKSYVDRQVQWNRRRAKAAAIAAAEEAKKAEKAAKAAQIAQQLSGDAGA